MAFDAATAVQAAAIAVLDLPALTDLGAQVWAHPPEIGPDPADDPLATGSIVLLHGLVLEPEGGKDGGLDRAVLTVVTLTRKPGPSHLSVLQAAVRCQIEEQPFEAAGAVLSQPVQTIAESQLMEDGATYMGTQKFEMLVQPA